MTALPDKPQPDALPAQSAAATPSLWLYVALIAVSFGLIAYAFALQGKPDWPGLLLNIAAGLIGAVVVLVLVDRRLRSSEIDAIRNLPRSASFQATAWFTPTGRLSQKYCQSLLVTLDKLVGHKLARPATSTLDALVLEGFVLLAEPGAGKTTWLQMVARSLASKTLTGHPSGRVPILFAIRQWREGQSLEQGVFELFSSFSPCWRWTFQRLLASGQAVLLLDGYDELWNQQMPLQAEVAGLRAKYPKLKCSITSRSNYPTPDPSVFGSSHQLPPPTDDEIREIQNRRSKRE